MVRLFQVLEEEVTKMLGIQRAFKRMQEQVCRWMKANLEEVQGLVSDKCRTLQERVNRLEEDGKAHAKESVIPQLHNYLQRFEQVLTAIYQGRPTLNPREERRAFQMEDLEAKLLFEDELKLFQVPRARDGWLGLDDLKEELSGSHLRGLLEEPLSPHAAFGRLLKVYQYLILRYPMRPIGLAEAHSLSGHSSSECTGTFDEHMVLSQLVIARLYGVQDIVQLAMLHCEAVYKQPVQRAHELLQEHFPTVKHFKGFISKLSARFGTALTERLERANSALQDHIDERTKFLAVGQTTGLIALLALCPLRQDMLSSSPKVCLV